MFDSKQIDFEKTDCVGELKLPKLVPKKNLFDHRVSMPLFEDSNLEEYQKPNFKLPKPAFPDRISKKQKGLILNWASYQERFLHYVLPMVQGVSQLLPLDNCPPEDDNLRHIFQNLPLFYRFNFLYQVGRTKVEFRETPERTVQFRTDFIIIPDEKYHKFDYILKNNLVNFMIHLGSSLNLGDFIIKRERGFVEGLENIALIPDLRQEVYERYTRRADFPFRQNNSRKVTNIIIRGDSHRLEKEHQGREYMQTVLGYLKAREA